MKIKMLRNTQEAGGRLLLAGKTYSDVLDVDARYLVLIGKAEEVEEKAGQSRAGNSGGGKGADGGADGAPNPPAS